MAYCTIGTAGHIDHGKTALVKALTGVDTDRLSEERRRGLSIELGFAHFEAPCPNAPGSTLHISIIDVPGHEKFVRTMLAGTTGIDMVLFVVAADDGVMPQSREHLDIVRLLNIERAVFVISKIDRVDEARVDEVKEEIEALIKGTPLEGSPFVSVSALTGSGIDALRALLVSACAGVKARESSPFFRLPVDRSFVIKGFGTVVTGTVASGVVNKGDTVSAFTSGVSLSGIRVRGIETAHQKVERVEAGRRGALNLVGLPGGVISRGTTLAASSLVDSITASLKRSSDKPVALRIDCSFEFLSSFDLSGVLKGKKRLKLFHLTGESLVSVRFPDKANPGFGRLTLDTPLLCLRGDYFILRDTATNCTVGGGRALLPYYSARLARAILSTDYPALKATDISKLLSALLAPGEVGLKVEGLDSMLNLTLPDIIKAADGYLHLGEFLLRRVTSDGLKESLLSHLKKFHLEKTSRDGLSVTDIATALKDDGVFSFRLAGAGLLKVVVQDMIDEGRLTRSGSLVRLAGHAASLDEVDEKISKAVLSFFVPLYETVRREQMDALPFKRDDVDRVVVYLLKKRRIVRLKEGKFLSITAIDEARVMLERVLASLAGIASHDVGHGGITVGEFRDVLGTGRKVAIEILEYFDRELVTLRHGDFRVLRGGKSRGSESIV